MKIWFIHILYIQEFLIKHIQCVEREREKTLILIHILTSYNREIYIQG